MKPIHSITNVLVGSLVGSLIGFVVAYLVQAVLVGDATITNIAVLSNVDTGTSRYLTVKNINLVAGASAGAVIGSIAGATVSIVQAVTMRRFSQERHDF